METVDDGVKSSDFPISEVDADVESSLDTSQDGQFLDDIKSIPEKVPFYFLRLLLYGPRNSNV